MDGSRREFLGRLTTGAALMSVAPFSLSDMTRDLATPSPALQPNWDLSWVEKVSGKHRAVFDIPEIESGYGLWRATVYGKQYNEVLGIPREDISTVVVIRHEGIWLAMNDEYWDKYGVGKKKNVLDMSEKPTDKNPGLQTLEGLISRGAIALACNLAFADVVGAVREKSKLNDEEARKAALSHLVPGVIMQPSGVFAAIRAQEAGCVYFRAS